MCSWNHSSSTLNLASSVWRKKKTELSSYELSAIVANPIRDSAFESAQIEMNSRELLLELDDYATVELTLWKRSQC